jgi:hypothetical protein
MLAIFILLLALGVFLGTFGKLESPSYILELLVGLVLFALWLRYYPRLNSRLGSYRHPNAFITGLLLTVFCLILNLIWVLSFKIEPTVDFYTFYHTAVQIATGQRVDMLYIGLFPHILGYSTFLSWFIKIFGESELLAPLVNLGLTVISGVCIYVLCLRWFGYKSAVFALIAWSLCPSKMMYNSMVMSEPLYTCGILLFLVFMSLVCDDGLTAIVRLIICIPCGLLCGILLMAVNAARPVALILFIAFFIWLVLLRGKDVKRLKVWGLLIIFSGAMLFSYSKCSDWWRRWEYLHVFEETSSIPAYNIYVGLNPDSLGSFSEEDMDLLMSYRYDQEKGSAVYAQEQMLEEAKKRLASGEINFPKLFATKLAKLMGNDEGGAFYAQDELSSLEFKLCTAVSNVFYYFVVMLCITGTIMLFKWPKYYSLYLVPLYSIGLILAHLIVEVSGRYKYSVIPMVIILASYAMCATKLKIFNKKAKTLG